MGCTFKLYVVDKDKTKDAKAYFSLGDRNISLAQFLNAKPCYDMGTLQCEDLIDIHKLSVRLFDDEKLQDCCVTEDPYILSKTAIKFLLNQQIALIVDELKNPLKDYTSMNVEGDPMYFQNAYTSLAKDIILATKLLDVDVDNEFRLLDTWLPQYEIFNLFYILKTLNFDKYDIVFMWGE